MGDHKRRKLSEKFRAKKPGKKYRASEATLAYPLYSDTFGLHLIRYVTDKGETEIVWNSRDGLAPSHIRSLRGHAAICHEVKYAPDYVPEVGSRIFVDMTEETGRRMAVSRVEKIIDQREVHEKTMRELGVPTMFEQFDSREEAIESAFRSIYNMDGGVPPPDLVVVTAGMIEEFVQRKEQSGQFAHTAQSERSEHVNPAGALLEMLAQSVIQDELDRTLVGIIASNASGGHALYNREGQRITDNEYVRLMQIEDYRIVALTPVEDCVVSTVWLGVAHSARGRPMIFETMVTGREDVYTLRYSTEKEALEGHEQIVASLSKGQHKKN